METPAKGALGGSPNMEPQEHGRSVYIYIYIYVFIYLYVYIYKGNVSTWLVYS